MIAVDENSFNSLVEHYLGTRLPGALADRVSLGELAPDARGVIVRMLALMRRAGCPATEFNPQMIELLARVTPGMLPSAWGGRIPPVTFAGRHRKLDAYVAARSGKPGGPKPVFVDWGCGFPPVTTVDSASRLPGWSVYGVDRSFARYLLHDPEGHYACFDRNGEFEYFQPQMTPLHDNPEDARKRFKSLFADLSGLLEATGGDRLESVEKDGSRLVFNPVRTFEGDDLKFVEAEVEDLRLPPAKVVRCMNVLLYYEKAVREKMQRSLGQRLADGGILISGMNHPFGIYTRYAVYRREAAGLVAQEFAFSPDNLRPLGIAPWLTLQENDGEAGLLADLTGALRADRGFWTAFDRQVDALQAQFGICRRGEDGFSRFTAEAQAAPAHALAAKEAALWQALEARGCADTAVEALARAGYRAWKNPVGDIAVRPPAGAL